MTAVSGNVADCKKTLPVSACSREGTSQIVFQVYTLPAYRYCNKVLQRPAVCGVDSSLASHPIDSAELHVC